MNRPLYQVDAFATVFSGNPAAVCLLDTWLDDTVLHAQLFCRFARNRVRITGRGARR